jgi:putative DNA methylase
LPRQQTASPGSPWSKTETARELCYRLCTLCEREKRAAEALSHNGLVQSRPEILSLATATGAAAVQPTAPDMFADGEET